MADRKIEIVSDNPDEVPSGYDPSTIDVADDGKVTVEPKNSVISHLDSRQPAALIRQAAFSYSD